MLFLTAAGVAAGSGKIPVMVGVDFCLSSVFSLLALHLFGVAGGTLVGAVIAGSPFAQHPPCLIAIMSLEIFVVGLFLKRSRPGMIQSDTLFWLLIGMPVLFFFYNRLGDLPASASGFHTLTQAVNSIVNALIARIFLTASSLCDGKRLTPLREVIFNLVTFFLLCPVFVFFVFVARKDFATTTLSIRSELLQQSGNMEAILRQWLKSRKELLAGVARLSAKQAPARLQTTLIEAAALDQNFLHFATVDAQGKLRPSPHRSEDLKRLLAKTQSYLLSRKTLEGAPIQEHLEIVSEGKGSAEPVAAWYLPLPSQNGLCAEIVGIINLRELEDLLRNTFDMPSTRYFLLDRAGDVILSNCRDQNGGKGSLPSGGKITRIDDRISQRFLDAAGNSHFRGAWGGMSYRCETQLHYPPEWKLIVEQPLNPYEVAMHGEYDTKLATLFLILIGSLMVAEILSSRIVSAFEQFNSVIDRLPEKPLAEDHASTWRGTRIKEAYLLMEKYRSMADALTALYHQINQLNESLEWRISERTKELVENEEQLKEAKQFAEQIIRCAREGIIVYDRDFKYSVWNPFMENLTGVPASDVIGRSVPEQFPFLVEADMIEPFERALYGPVVDGTAGKELDLMTVSMQGERIWTSHINSPLFNSKGEVTGVIATVREITWRKQMEEEMRLALKSAESANTMMTRLLRTVSHEFRTPLGLLTCGVDILDRYWGKLTPKARYQHHDMIRKAASQLTTLVDSVTSFNRTQSNSGSTIQMADLALTCRAIATDVATVWGGRHRFEVAIAPGCGSAPLDESLFRRVLENLLTNAFRFTPADGEVTLNVDRTGDLLRLEVTDSGIGIPVEDQQRIFEAFYRSHNVEERRGLGLGLSIVHEALAKLEGNIMVRSVIGAGTSMTVEIPLD